MPVLAGRQPSTRRCRNRQGAWSRRPLRRAPAARASSYRARVPGDVTPARSRSHAPHACARYARPEAPLASCNLALGRPPPPACGLWERKLWGKHQRRLPANEVASSEEPIHSATSGRAREARRGAHPPRVARPPALKKARRCRRAPRLPSCWCLSRLSVLNHRPRAPWRPRVRRSRPRAGCARAQRRRCRCPAAWWRRRSES